MVSPARPSGTAWILFVKPSSSSSAKALGWPVAQNVFGAQMRQSSEKIHALERNLESAVRDATKDALTGVSNRKAFEQTIRSFAGEAMNTGEDLALLLVDIDHFKRVNDTWGHQAGDAVLRHVAQTLSRAVRGQDHVARYGGEEFSVLLPRADLHAAVCVAENIREALIRDPLFLESFPAMVRSTVSLGAACYEPGESLMDWIGRSDAALYDAKAAGRNCVMCRRLDVDPARKAPLEKQNAA